MIIKRAHIEVSGRCNYKCITCKHGYEDYGEDLSPDICDLLIKDVIPYLDTLELQGTGESLLNPEVIRLIQAAINFDTDVLLITNGSLLTETHMNLLVLAGAQVVISLDGSNEVMYRVHRPVGNFERVIGNIRRLNKIRHSMPDRGCSIVINMVLTQLNVSDLPNMIELLSGLGVDYLFVSEVRQCMPDLAIWNRLNLLSQSHTQTFQSMIEECNSLAHNRGLGFSFNPYVKPSGIKKAVCVSPWEHVFIFANGDVSVCCELSQVFGNLHQNSLDEILSGEAITLFRKRMLKGEYDDDCLNCCLPWGLPY